MLLKNYTLEIFKSKCQSDAKGSSDCPPMDDKQRGQLDTYMKQFNLDI